MKWGRTVAGVAICVVVSSCSADRGGSSTGNAAPSPQSTEDVFAQFPDCPSPRPGRKVKRVPGLLLPEETIVYTVRRQGPITTVQGFVMMTPIEVREYYEADPDIQILVGEDEFIESELLFTNGEVRNFVKARAACKDGSDIVTVIARELTALPSPAGTPAPLP